MPNIIQISDQRNGVLSFDLVDLLRLIPTSAKQLIWSILDLDQFVQTPENAYALGKELVAVNEQAHDTVGGYILSWNTLIVYAESISQVVDGIFVCCQSIEGLLRLNSESTDNDLYTNAEIVLEAFDSSCWIVYSRNDEYIDCLRAAYHDIQELKVPFRG